ncbi:hypothetical protein, partial [Cereibacter changlensis]|uniref:hypothetical protein n=1 Tax=Cereibacter changlensis TaxID=402884 RepID=UPI00145DCF83
QIALYLPAMSTEKTYKKSLLKVFSEEIGDTYVIPAHLHFWSTYPEGKSIFLLSREEKDSAITLYDKVFAIYIKVINPEAGLQSIAQFLEQLGCDQTIKAMVVDGYRSKLKTRREFRLA